jgi:Mg/Co/Ni transporter MgtE
VLPLVLLMLTILPGITRDVFVNTLVEIHGVLS